MHNGMTFSNELGSYSCIWYPATGYRFSGDDTLFDVGTMGKYWSSTSSNMPPIAVHLLNLREDGTFGPSDGSGRVYGLSVRCLQE